MARPGVTYTEVSTAAQQLVAAGKFPTIETIRRILGTGSNSTLSAHLRMWKAQQDQTQLIATKENLPEELIAVLKGLWERVMNQSEDKIFTIKQEIQQEREQLVQEVARLQRDNAIAQQQYQHIKQERDSFTHEKYVVEQLQANAKIEIATLTEKLAGFEQQSQEKQARIDELHRQNQQVQANLEHYRTASLEQRRYEQQQKQLEQTILQLNQELSKTKQATMIFQQQTQQAIFENDSLKTQLNKLHMQYESLTIRLTDVNNELARKTQDQQHWKTQCDSLQNQWSKLNKSFLDLKTQHAVLSGQLEMLTVELKETREQNKVLAHEKWVLGQEKSVLFGQLKQLETQL